MPQTATASEQRSQQAGSGARIAALDFTKGILVMFMVLYHWLNYFYRPYGDFYNYLRFLTPSFTFITGFLVSHVYFAKYGASNKQVPPRLALRGLKVLAVYFVLNAIIVLMPNSPNRAALAHGTLASNLATIFVTGNVLTSNANAGHVAVVYGKSASFGVLVPIGYLLLLSALMAKATRRFRHIFQVVSVLLFGAVLLLQRFGAESSYLEQLSIGLLGVVLGYYSSSEIRRVISNPYVLGISYGAYLIAITVWNVPFVLRVVGVCLTLAIFYAVGDWIAESTLVGRHTMVLGKYSLFGYIWQIVLLQVLYRLASRGSMGIGVLIVSFIASFALTMTGVEAMDRLRARWRVLDQAYRYTFA